MSVAWSWAFDTPFKWTKQVASHFGGTRQGMAIAWPGRIKDAGGIRTQFHHMIDIVPTILEATGIPGAADGQRHRAEADRRREHGLHLRQGECRMRHRRARRSTSRCSRNRGDLPRRLDRLHDAAGAAVGCWARPSCPTTCNGYKWELYNLTEDYLAVQRPRRQDAGQAAGRLQELFLVEATKYNVFPLDNSILPAPASRRGPARPPVARCSPTRVRWRAASERRAEHPQPLLHDHRRGRNPAGRRRRNARHQRRPLRRLSASTC